MPPVNNLFSGVRYFLRGARLLMHPALRFYVVVPLLINCVLFVILTALLVGYLTQLNTGEWNLPAWLAFLERLFNWVAWLLIAVVLLVVYGYLFNVTTNLLAAPFYALLAQRTEALLTGVESPTSPIAPLLLRTLGRELQKLVYFISRGVFVLLLMLLFSTLAAASLLMLVLGILWGAWCMVVQYADYPADNHHNHFRRLRKKLRRRRYSSLGFGSAVMLCSLIPVINILVMPAAVTGGTLFWLNELKQMPLPSKEQNIEI